MIPMLRFIMMAIASLHTTQAIAQDQNRKNEVVQIPPSAIWIECSGVSHTKESELGDVTSVNEKSLPDTSVFAIDERSQRLYRYLASDGGFFEYCPDCERKFTPTSISWIWSNVSLKEGILIITTTSGSLDRIQGTMTGEYEIEVRVDGKPQHFMKNYDVYPRCIRVDPATYVLGTKRF